MPEITLLRAGAQPGLERKDAPARKPEGATEQGFAAILAVALGLAGPAVQIPQPQAEPAGEASAATVLPGFASTAPAAYRPLSLTQAQAPAAPAPAAPAPAAAAPAAPAPAAPAPAAPAPPTQAPPTQAPAAPAPPTQAPATPAPPTQAPATQAPATQAPAAPAPPTQAPATPAPPTPAPATQAPPTPAPATPAPPTQAPPTPAPATPAPPTPAPPTPAPATPAPATPAPDRQQELPQPVRVREKKSSEPVAPLAGESQPLRPEVRPLQSEVPRVDPPAAPIVPEEVMERVVKSVAQAPDGSYHLNLQLHPEHLGAVRLQVVVSGKDVQTVFVVENAAAGQALSQQGEHLRQGLQEAGLALSGFQVETGAGGGSRQGRSAASDKGEPGRRPRGRITGGEASLQGIGPATRTNPRPGGLDTMA
jgi:flagellar hook-length control protein FliK